MIEMNSQRLKRQGKADLAYRYTPPAPAKGKIVPTVIFMGGYRSDMSGTKARYLEEQCAARGQGYIRFDYSGHGESGGKFEDGTIGDWLGDALAVMDRVTSDPLVIVGSSMGGWIALCAALARPGSVHGLIGIAAAPDFTEDLFSRLSANQQKTLMETGYAAIENDYSDEPYHYTKRFYEEAKSHLILHSTHKVDFPLRLIQGMQDKDVPWETAVKIQNAFSGGDVDIVFIEDGDHRLSRPEDLEIIDSHIRILSGIL